MLLSGLLLVVEVLVTQGHKGILGILVSLAHKVILVQQEFHFIRLHHHLQPQLI
jgi:hypothetical protein